MKPETAGRPVFPAEVLPYLCDIAVLGDESQVDEPFVAVFGQRQPPAGTTVGGDQRQRGFGADSAQLLARRHRYFGGEIAGGRSGPAVNITSAGGIANRIPDPAPLNHIADLPIQRVG
ncbi:hypothetical protein SDC9_114030 [bioreactor metagenome]|uniref:Uncharacterized protein n=1 Tax=bioreactor metagenome TaxID=1076179 RepID=A0A645BV71_9ZZZZ